MPKHLNTTVVPALSAPPGRQRLGMGLPWEVASVIGRVEKRVGRSGKASYRVDIRWEGERWRIGQAPIAGHWTKLDTPEIAEFVLNSIRVEASECGSVPRAIAPFLNRPDDLWLVPNCMTRFVGRERDREAGGEISPRTLGELERQVRAGDFDWWAETHVFSIKFGLLEDWAAHLTKAGKGPVIRRRLLENFRRMLRWLHKRGDLDATPDFPKIPYDQKAPEVLLPREQAAVLAEIAWEKRGLFLAMAHTIRPGEARAADLLHWRAPDILVQQAVKGITATAPIRGLKERDWRVVGADDRLGEWIVWRMEQATPEERLRRLGVPLFPNPRTGGRWSHHAIAREWGRATERAKVRYVPPYAGTKHTTSTNLVRQGVPAKTLQKFLGHADMRSTDRYVVLGSRDVKDTIRGRTEV